MSLNEANTDRGKLRNYLLGQLPEGLAMQLDERLFADDAMRQELEEEQTSLVEDFVYGCLTEEEERRFQEQCSRSVHLREEVTSLRVLLSALELQHAQSPAPFVWSLKQILTVLSTALALILCFAAFMYVHERRKSAALVSQTTPPVTTSAQSHPHEAPSIAFLSANVARGSSFVPKIKIPSAGTALELRIEVRSPSSSVADWDVALLRDNEVIQSSSHVPLHRLRQETYLSLTIDAASIHAGPYSLRYSPHADPGAPQYRSFQGVN